MLFYRYCVYGVCCVIVIKSQLDRRIYSISYPYFSYTRNWRLPSVGKRGHRRCTRDTWSRIQRRLSGCWMSRCHWTPTPTTWDSTTLFLCPLLRTACHTEPRTLILARLAWRKSPLSHIIPANIINVMHYRADYQHMRLHLTHPRISSCEPPPTGSTSSCSTCPPPAEPIADNIVFINDSGSFSNLQTCDIKM